MIFKTTGGLSNESRQLEVMDFTSLAEMKEDDQRMTCQLPAGGRDHGTTMGRPRDDHGTTTGRPAHLSWPGGRRLASSGEAGLQAAGCGL